MRLKQIIISILVFIVIIAFLSLMIYHFSIIYSRDRAFKGSVDVYYYDNTTIDQINNISCRENLTISSIKNVTLYNDEYIEVVYKVKNRNLAEEIKKRLEKYNEIYVIEIYDDI